MREFSHDEIDGASASAECAIEFSGLCGGGGLAVKQCEFFEVDVPGVIAGGLDEFVVCFCENGE